MKGIRPAFAILFLCFLVSCNEQSTHSQDEREVISSVVKNARYDLELLANGNTKALTWRFPENSEIGVVEIEEFIGEVKQLGLWPLQIKTLPTSRERGNLLASIKARGLGNEPPFLIKAEITSKGSPRLIDLIYRKHDHRLLAIIVSETEG